MARAFEPNGIFYRMLERDARRWPVGAARISEPPSHERRPLSHHPRPRIHRLSELPPPHVRSESKHPSSPAIERRTSTSTVVPSRHVSGARALRAHATSPVLDESSYVGPLPAAAELLIEHRRAEKLGREREVLLEEVEELRHQVAEARRSTEERKAMFLRELNKLRLERATLVAHVERMESELASSRSMALAVVQQSDQDRRLKRGLAATGGLATATGVLSLAVLLKNAFSFGRRLSWLRHA